MQATAAASLAFLFLATGCTMHKTIVNIIDVRETREPAPGVSSHKDHDVIVRREKYNGDDHILPHETYTVYFYRKENDSLRCYQAGWGTCDDLDRASYKWLADTMASVRLYSSTSRKKVKFQVFGRHNSDGTKTSVISTYE